MNAQQLKEKIKIEALLNKEGFSPYKVNSAKNIWWYLSPFRKESSPSFKIDLKKQTWHDFGIGKGGSIIDFIIEKKGLNFKETIHYLNENFNIISNQKINIDKKSIAKTNSLNLKISNVKNIEKSYLIDYIVNERCVDLDLARKYCDEIYFSIIYSNNIKKNYVAIGFKNIDGGYEIRTKSFKGNTTEKNKNITFIDNGSKILKTFEGFMDFLSYLTLKPEEEFDYNFLILNSTSFLLKIDPSNDNILFDKSLLLNNKLYQIIMLHKQIDHYFDNDITGNLCKEIIKNLHKKTNDNSYLYEGYNDFNHMLTEQGVKKKLSK